MNILQIALKIFVWLAPYLIDWAKQAQAALPDKPGSEKMGMVKELTKAAYTADPDTDNVDDETFDRAFTHVAAFASPIIAQAKRTQVIPNDDWPKNDPTDQPLVG